MPSNRLAQEKSPYLLQHAQNPVDWYPWGEEAFEKARREDKPIFLSIGYSTCHWCHVMEHESFENEATAALLNRWFVAIKMDREERPDIDRIYMTYVQATTGGGGWPMSVWLTPELKPFVGGTYFPPDGRYGRPGFPMVLERIAQAWRDDRARIEESSRKVMEQLREQAASGSGSAGGEHDGNISAAAMDTAYNQLRRSYDSRFGGFGQAPKFPRPSVHNFLLRYAKRTGKTEAQDMVVETLLAMERGGMHDQLGGGFHRYSVDETWFVPHFEKMLYDQAQLAVSYLEAYQLAREPVLAEAATRILESVMRDLTSPEGGFYSAEDADSAPDAAEPGHKSEGAFYIWSLSEVAGLVGDERALWVAFRYGMEPDGNVRNDPHNEFAGRNILFAAHTVEETGRHFGMPVEAVAAGLREAEATLFEARAKRPRPHLDDKILTSWNGLMISAFAKGSAILGVEVFQDAARRAADFVLTKLRTADGSLLRRYRDGDAAIAGMLDDYAFFVQGLLDLYEATFDFRYLQGAVELNDQQSRLLEDRSGGGFYASGQADAAGLVQMKDDYDGAEPSGNSVALLNLLRLERITGRAELGDSARKVKSAFRSRLEGSPYGLPQMLAALEFEMAPQREIVVAGPLTEGMRRLLWKNFDPNRVLLGAAPELAGWQPATAAMTGGVYICENFTCQAPVTNEAELSKALSRC